MNPLIFYIFFIVLIFSCGLIYACYPKNKKLRDIKIGDLAYFCVYLGPLDWGSHGKYLQIAAKVKVDKLTKIRVPKSWTSNNYSEDIVIKKLSIEKNLIDGNGLGVGISSMGVLSYQKIYRDITFPPANTSAPTRIPTFAPTNFSTISPSITPSYSPTLQPTFFNANTSTPTLSPSIFPTFIPTLLPNTSIPTITPIIPPSLLPSLIPTYLPTNSTITPSPSNPPTISPTFLPSQEPTFSPTFSPTLSPTLSPTAPSFFPTESPSISPTFSPSDIPTQSPASTPTLEPTIEPTFEPTFEPSLAPSIQPTSVIPSLVPSLIPTRDPTLLPTFDPTLIPTLPPTLQPSFEPTNESPTYDPTVSPAFIPPVRRYLRNNFEENILVYPLVNSNDSISYNATNMTYIGRTYPILFAVVVLDHGKVKSISWDNNCNWCSVSHCRANTLDYNNTEVNKDGKNCFIYDHQCVEPLETGNSTTNSLCELNIYISWYGTDRDGTNFVSVSSRMSRWSRDQMTNYTSSMKEKLV